MHTFSLQMMSQPPYDTKLAPFYILHYTYGNDYDAEGNFTPGEQGARAGLPQQCGCNLKQDRGRAAAVAAEVCSQGLRL